MIIKKEKGIEDEYEEGKVTSSKKKCKTKTKRIFKANRFIGPIKEGCIAPSQVSGRSEARLEIFLSICTEIYKYWSNMVLSH